MITINSHCVDSSSHKNKKEEEEEEELKLQRQTLLYKIACVCYLLVIIVLLTFFVVRAFKSKYRLETDCTSNNWIDAVITILTLIAIFLSSVLLVASLKYVSESENASEKLSEVSPQERREDFIRRNSQQQQQLPTVVTINRNPSISSGSWLSAVRNEAYERRMSMAPTHNLKLETPK